MDETMIKRVETMIMQIYRVLFTPYTYYLGKELEDCYSILDLGCGSNSPIQYYHFHYSIGVELFEQYIQQSKTRRIHSDYIKADIRKIEFKEKSFDAVLALDVVEHLTKEEGHELIQKMEKWAKKKIIIFTPNGHLHQNGYDDNPLQLHKSGWKVKEFKELGFKVFGINGWKTLRGYRAELRFKPELIWQIISDLTQEITYYYPKFAFQLFCVMEVK